MKNNPTSQLRQVVLLLAITVILPTVCLLWFMTQAVRNERLAVRQKLIDSYVKRAEDIFFKYPDNYWSTAEKNWSDFSAFIIYDQNDNITIPLIRSQYPKSFPDIILPDEIHKIWKLEYSEKNLDEAIKQYNLIYKTSSAGEVKHECEIGIVRCLTKQNKFNEAITACRELAYPNQQYIKGKYTPELISRDKLMLVSLYSRTNHKDLLKELQNQFPETIKIFIPTETKIFILSQLIEIAKTNSLTGKLAPEIEKAQKLIESSQLSLTVADYIEKTPSLKSHQLNTFYKIGNSLPIYGIYFKFDNRKMLGLLTEEKMKQFWQKSVDDFTDELVFCRIYDTDGEQVVGEPKNYIGQEVVTGEIFATLNLKKSFAGWKVELYLRAGVFKEAADKKMVVYVWVAGAVILLMLASTFLAGSAVLKQAKLNKLKNDFIATITHELKTPLASMRILVDTLLEGKCQSRGQEIEYLQLVSKENARLSRLFDNFLTFSRMERNKQAFDFASVAGGEIAKAAAEAVQTKFNGQNCKFTVTIDANLPSILADKDAMITVLVNLLDNAFKYSGEIKEISLNAFADGGTVCFVVKDNGIGLTRRQMKKVFDKFYQVDSSLSRKVEGTGLGLSIVKFIVDAHKGKIDVESKLGKGSEFKIIVPIIKVLSGEI